MMISQSRSGWFGIVLLIAWPQQGYTEDSTAEESTETVMEWGVAGAYQFPANAGVASAIPPRGAQPSSGGGGGRSKAYFLWKGMRPFLRRDHPFLRESTLAISLKGTLSPVGFEVSSSLGWTPAAYFSLDTGLDVGFGWRLKEWVGLGFTEEKTGKRIANGRGAMLRLWASGTLRFSLAALFPGEWNRLVMLASGIFSYHRFTGASDGQAWIYQSDLGENFNGARYQGTYVIGYQMPLFVSFVGFVVETDERLGRERFRSPMAREGWGSDFVTVVFGPVASVSLPKRSTLSIAFQMTNKRSYSQATASSGWFQDRQVVGSYVHIHQVALLYKQEF